MGLENIDKTYKTVRVAGINAQIKEHRDAIKRLEKKRAVFSSADAIDAGHERDDADDAGDSTLI
jgi:hypothetical protein